MSREVRVVLRVLLDLDLERRATWSQKFGSLLGRRFEADIFCFEACAIVEDSSSQGLRQQRALVVETAFFVTD